MNNIKFQCEPPSAKQPIEKAPSPFNYVYRPEGKNIYDLLPVNKEIIVCSKLRAVIDFGEDGGSPTQLLKNPGHSGESKRKFKRPYSCPNMNFT